MTRDCDIQHPIIEIYARTGYPSYDYERCAARCGNCGCELDDEETCPDAVCAECQEVLSRYDEDEPA